MKLSKRVAFYGIFAALAILMGYIEHLVPLPVPVPGIKLGLANVIVLICLYFMGRREAFFISMVRILISGLLFAGFAGFLYSMSGALLSYAMMCLFQRIKGMSIVGVSIIGGISHNIGQILMACLVMGTYKLIYYFPILLAAGVVTGILTGIVARYCLEYLKKSNISAHG